jgi:hypothetical protein
VAEARYQPRGMSDPIGQSDVAAKLVQLHGRERVR